MADEIIVHVSASGDRLEIALDDGFYSLGIYDPDGEPVTDVLLNETEARELVGKLTRALKE